MIFTLSNGLSFLRAPLAFLILAESTIVRVTAILLAMLTDCIDGYVARRRGTATQFGAVLDPAMDKFFVLFALGVFLFEGKLLVWQACAMISRDFFLCIFGIYLTLSGYWEAYEFKSIRWGKITTAMQFIVLISLSCNLHIPSYLYILFILFGSLAFIELKTIAERRLQRKERKEKE